MSAPSAVVRWPDAADEILAGDLTTALAYVTPAGGAVVTTVAPLGVRDRDTGRLTFTTSYGFGRKLERIARDLRVALAYHARAHGFSAGSAFVLVQGRAEVDHHPNARLRDELERAAVRSAGPLRRGAFWSRWLREYYDPRVPVHVRAERVTVWPDIRCAGTPEVLGAAAQDPPGRAGRARGSRRAGSLAVGAPGADPGGRPAGGTARPLLPRAADRPHAARAHRLAGRAGRPGPVRA